MGAEHSIACDPCSDAPCSAKKDAAFGGARPGYQDSASGRPGSYAEPTAGRAIVGLVGSAKEAVEAAPKLASSGINTGARALPLPGHARYMSASTPLSDTAHDRNGGGGPVFVGQSLVATVEAPASAAAQIGRLRGTQLPLGAVSGQTSQRLVRAHVTSSFQQRTDQGPSHAPSIDKKIVLASGERANAGSYTTLPNPFGSPRTVSDSKTAASLSQATRLSELYSDTRKQFGGSANRNLTQPHVLRVSPIAHPEHNESHAAAVRHASATQSSSINGHAAHQSSKISGAAFGPQISEVSQTMAEFPEFAHLATPDALYDSDSVHITPRIGGDQAPDTSRARPSIAIRVDGFTREEEAAAYASVAAQDLRDAPRPPYAPPPLPPQMLPVEKMPPPSPMQERPPSYPPPPRPTGERGSGGLEAKLRVMSGLLKDSEMDALLKLSMQLESSGGGHARVWSEDEPAVPDHLNGVNVSGDGEGADFRVDERIEEVDYSGEHLVYHGTQENSNPVRTDPARAITTDIDHPLQHESLISGWHEAGGV